MVLANTSARSRNCHFFSVVRTFRIYSLSNFPAYNTFKYITVLLIKIIMPLFSIWLHLDQTSTSCKGLSSRGLRCPMRGSREGSTGRGWGGGGLVLQEVPRQLCKRAKSLSCVRFFVDPVGYTPPGSSVQGISQARHWSGLPVLPPL